VSRWTISVSPAPTTGAVAWHGWQQRRARRETSRATRHSARRVGSYGLRWGTAREKQRMRRTVNPGAAVDLRGASRHASRGPRRRTTRRRARQRAFCPTGGRTCEDRGDRSGGVV
jgi:hypothetical protein